MPRRSNLIRTIPVYFKEYEVSFDVKLTGIVSSQSSLLHITKGGNTNIGDMMPSIFFKGRSNRMTICTHINSKSSCSSVFISSYTFCNIKIQQKKLSEKDFEYTIRYNNHIVRKFINRKPLTLYNAKVYLGDPWYSAAKVQVKNLIIKSEPTGTIVCNSFCNFKIFFAEVFIFSTTFGKSYNEKS